VLSSPDATRKSSFPCDENKDKRGSSSRGLKATLPLQRRHKNAETAGLVSLHITI
jgi:hypothetical protein